MRPLPAPPFLYAIVDAGMLAGRPVGAAVAELVRGGARLVQYRGKGLTDRLLFEQAREALGAARASAALIIVNDRPDVALILGADGVHVGQDDLSPQDCRRLLGPEAIVGLSTHNREDLLAAAGAPVDYVAVGPIYPTVTKAVADPVVGIDFLREARRLTSKPLVAIGGITRRNAAAVVAAGADSVAVVSDLLRQDDLAEAARAFTGALRSPHG